MRVNSCLCLLLGFLAAGSFAGCGSRQEQPRETPKAVVAQPPVEEPPPPEPASLLGTASGSFKAVEFADAPGYFAYEKDPSAANLHKAKGRLDQQFQSAIAKWKSGAHTLVVYLFPGALSPSDAEALRQSIVQNEGKLLRDRVAKRGSVTTLTLEFLSGPPYDAAHLSMYIIASRADNDRMHSYQGKGDTISFTGKFPSGKPSWGKPGRLLPEIELKTKKSDHWSGSSLGHGEWDLQARVPIIYVNDY